jgi:hypothetical protein
MDDIITRAEMAKLIVNYVTNFQVHTPAILSNEASFDKQKCTAFIDLDQADAELQEFVIKVCEYGLMGYHSDGVTIKDMFYPNEPITRAEVATVISRMLRGTLYRGTEQRRYHNHLLVLEKVGIIRQDIDPMTFEPRRNVFIMLNRI